MKFVLTFLLLGLAFSYAENCYNTNSCVHQNLTHCSSPTTLKCENHLCQCLDSTTPTLGNQCTSVQDCSGNCDGIFFIPLCENGFCHCQAH